MSQPKPDEIAARAYRIWEAEGRPMGKAQEHWRRAEQELANEGVQQQPGTARDPKPDQLAPARPKEVAVNAPQAPGEVIESTRKPKILRGRPKSTERLRN